MSRTTNKQPATTFERIAAAAGAFAIVAAMVVVKLANPTTTNWLPQCPLHALTGLHCPGCGATRGMHRLLNGDVLAALDYNVLLVAFVPLMLYGFAWLIALAARGRGLPARKFSSGAALGFCVAMFAFGVLRNVPFYPFTILAP